MQRIGLVLLGGSLIPSQGLFLVARGSLAVFISTSEIILSQRQTQFGRALEQLEGLVFIFGNASSGQIQGRQSIQRLSVVLIRCFLIPASGFRHIAGNAFPQQIQIAQSALRFGVALLGRKTHPFPLFGLVFGDSASRSEKLGETILRVGESLARRQEVPANGFFEVLFDVSARFVHEAEIRLRLPPSLARRLPRPSKPFGFIARGSPALQIKVSEIALCFGTPFLRRAGKPEKGLAIILLGALPQINEPAELRHSFIQTLIGGFPQPRQRLPGVGFHADAHEVKYGQIELRARMPGTRGTRRPFGGALGLRNCSRAVDITPAQLILPFGISLIGRFLRP